ncbi:MAG: hypothetical protein ACI4WG_06825 [Erysipelotrichaceae bacterium]
MKKSDETIQLSKTHIKKRFVAFVICLLVALFAFFTAIKNLTYFEPGYQTITADEIYDDELVFNYYCQDRATYKQVSAVYRDLTKEIYQLLDEANSYESVINICYLNQNINQVITVDSVLYQQLQKVVDNDCREIFLAPVYTLYKALFSCDQDYQTDDFNPDKNAEIRALIDSLITFINDQEAVSIELLENNQVKVNVSPQYSQFMSENGLDTYIDFYWMKNAFIVDYVCDNLTERGYTDGYICSYDGYGRFMDCDEVLYHYYDILDDEITHICDVEVNQNHCLVTYKSFIMNQFDFFYRYIYQDKTVDNCYIDIKDGNDYSAVTSLNIYRETNSVVDTMMVSFKYYIADELSLDEVDFDYFYLENNDLISKGSFKISNLYDKVTN